MDAELAALGAEFPRLGSACKAGEAKPVGSGWKSAPFQLARARQGPLVTQAGWGDIAPVPGESPPPLSSHSGSAAHPAALQYQAG